MKTGDEERTESQKSVSQKRKADFKDESEALPSKKRTYVLHDPLTAICFKKVFGQKVFMLSLLNGLFSFKDSDSLADIQYLEEDNTISLRNRSPLLHLLCTQNNDQKFHLKIHILRTRHFFCLTLINSPALWISQWENRHTDTNPLITTVGEALPLREVIFFDYREPALDKQVTYVTHHQNSSSDAASKGQEWTLVDLPRARSALHAPESTADILSESTKWLKFLTSVGEIEVIGEEDDLWVRAYREIARLLKVEPSENEKAILEKKRRKDEKVSKIMKDAGQNGPLALAWIIAGYSNEEIHKIVEIDEKVLERLRAVETSA